MCSTDLQPFVKGIVIDLDRKVTPKRVVTGKTGLRFVYADHLPIIIVLEGLNTSKQVVKADTRWNVFKPGGWEAYEELTNKFADGVEKVISDKTKTIDEVIKKFDSIQDKIKYKAFGKTKIKKRVNRNMEITEGMDDNSDDARDMLAKQSKKIEDEIQSINKNCSGRVTNVF